MSSISTADAIQYSFTIICLPIFVIGCLAFHRLRAVFPIRGRLPALTIIQNIVLYAYLCHLALIDRTPCLASYWLHMIGLNAVLVIFCVRAFVLLFHFEVSKNLEMLHKANEKMRLTVHPPTTEDTGRETQKQFDRAFQALVQESQQDKAKAEDDRKRSPSPGVKSNPTAVLPQEEEEDDYDDEDGARRLLLERSDGMWYLSHRYLISTRFLLKTVLTIAFVLLAGLVSLTLTDKRLRVHTPCYSIPTKANVWEAVPYAPALFFLGLLLYFAIRLQRHGVDGFFIKRELMWCSVLCLLLEFLQVLAWRHQLGDFSSLPALLCGASLFVLTTIMPIYFTRYDQELRASTFMGSTYSFGTSKRTLHDLEDVLASEAGFCSFFEFLKAEFSSENLLFWKSVQEFRSTFLAARQNLKKLKTKASEPVHEEGEVEVENAEEQRYKRMKILLDGRFVRKARAICCDYISQGAPLQINLSHQIREHIERTLDQLEERWVMACYHHNLADPSSNVDPSFVFRARAASEREKNKLPGGNSSGMGGDSFKAGSFKRAFSPIAEGLVPMRSGVVGNVDKSKLLSAENSQCQSQSEGGGNSVLTGSEARGGLGNVSGSGLGITGKGSPSTNLAGSTRARYHDNPSTKKSGYSSVQLYDAFDRAQKEIFTLMKRDSFRRYRESPRYQQLVTLAKQGHYKTETPAPPVDTIFTHPDKGKRPTLSASASIPTKRRDGDSSQSQSRSRPNSLRPAPPADFTALFAGPNDNNRDLTSPVESQVSEHHRVQSSNGSFTNLDVKV